MVKVKHVIRGGVIARAYLDILEQNDGNEEAAAKQVRLTLEQFQKIIKEARDVLPPPRKKKRKTFRS